MTVSVQAPPTAIDVREHPSSLMAKPVPILAAPTFSGSPPLLRRLNVTGPSPRSAAAGESAATGSVPLPASAIGFGL